MLQSPQKGKEVDLGKNSVSPGMVALHLLRLSMAESLNPIQYQVFALCFLEQIPQMKLNEMLNMSASAISRCYHRCLYNIRRFWKTPKGLVVKTEIIYNLKQVLIEPQFTVFYKHIFEGKQQKAISNELGISRSAVSRRYTRARYTLLIIWNS